LSRALALASGQVVLICLALEGLGRIADPLGISYYPESARFFDRLVRAEPLGYRLPPGMDDRFWGAHVRVNALGMRDRELPEAKPADELRVMLLGDSLVFSSGVEYEDSIPAQLERVLNEDPPPGRHYRTLNMGVPSYNTEQELVQLETLGLRLEPDLVVLYFATNDIEPRMWVYERRQNVLADWAQRSYAASIVTVLIRRTGARMGWSSAGEPIHYASFAQGNPRWEAIEAALHRIAELLRERGIPFAVVSAGPGDAPHMRLLREVGAEAGFAIAQLDGSIEPEWRADPAAFVNSPTDPHCNPRGCSVLARHLARILRESGALDQSSSAPPDRQ
jgi:lysophospholipase L1-like esterase